MTTREWKKQVGGAIVKFYCVVAVIVLALSLVFLVVATCYLVAALSEVGALWDGALIAAVILAVALLVAAPLALGILWSER